MKELETRRRIYEEIVLNPGLHFRELQRRLNMPVGMLEYHLNVLIKYEFIIAKKDGAYTRFFANTVMSHEERKIMSVLRNEITRKITIFLLEKEGAKQKEISKYIGLTPSTVSYHLSKLLKNGIIEREVKGRESYYTLKNPELLTRVLIRYRRSFLDSLVDNFVKLWKKKEK